MIASPVNQQYRDDVGELIAGYVVGDSGRPDALDKQARSEIARWTQAAKRGNIAMQ